MNHFKKINGSLVKKRHSKFKKKYCASNYQGNARQIFTPTPLKLLNALPQEM